jgi:nitric oxide reductase NorE protein
MLKNDFFMVYFVFTGIHCLHVVLGLCVLAFMRSIARRQVRLAHDLRTLESGATFWHLVDVLWVALFALLYIGN